MYISDLAHIVISRDRRDRHIERLEKGRAMGGVGFLIGGSTVMSPVWMTRCALCLATQAAIGAQLSAK